MMCVILGNDENPPRSSYLTSQCSRWWLQRGSGPWGQDIVLVSCSLHCSPRKLRPPRVPLQGPTGPAFSRESHASSLSPRSAGRASPCLASGRGSEGEHPSARGLDPGAWVWGEASQRGAKEGGSEFTVQLR